MKTDYTDLMHAVHFKDTVNAYKANHNQDVDTLIAFLEDEVAELKQAYHHERKASALLEVADIVVFAGMLYEKIKLEPRK